jgi:hypothetical protein
MKRKTPQFLLLTSLLLSTQLSVAGEVERSYGKVVADKVLNGLANVATGWLEIPKSMINTTNEAIPFHD